MRALIGIAIIATVLLAANKTWTNIQRDFQQKQMIETAKASIDKLNTTINTKLATASNPFTATPAAAAQEAPAVLSNPTPIQIDVPKDCSGMACYPDLEKPLTVVAAN